jgi:hypothetical protein
MYVTPSKNLAVQLKMVYISNPLRITRRTFCSCVRWTQLSDFHGRMPTWNA